MWGISFFFWLHTLLSMSLSFCCFLRLLPPLPQVTCLRNGPYKDIIYAYIIYIYIYIYIYTYIIYMVFITEAFFEVAIESCPSGIWTHNHWIPFRRSNRMSYQATSSTPTQSQLCEPLQSHRLFSVAFHFGHCLRQSPRLFQLKFCWGNHMSVAEWVDTYVIHHRSILWSSYRKLPRVGFEPTTTELRSDALTNWAIRPRVQLPLRANFAQPLQSHRLLSVAFHFGHCLRQSPRLFQSKFCWGNHMSVAEYIYKYI